MNDEPEYSSLPKQTAGQLFSVQLAPYSDTWKGQFEGEKARILQVLRQYGAKVEHVGSTAVKGLAALPTVDILIEIPDLTDEMLTAITLQMQSIGYERQSNALWGKGVAFHKGSGLHRLYGQTYDVSVCEMQDAIPDEVYFREYLRRKPTVRKAYEALKGEVAEKYRYDKECYVHAKTEFITEMTRRAKAKKARR